MENGWKCLWSPIKRQFFFLVIAVLKFISTTSIKRNGLLLRLHQKGFADYGHRSRRQVELHDFDDIFKILYAASDTFGLASVTLVFFENRRSWLLQCDSASHLHFLFAKFVKNLDDCGESGQVQETYGSVGGLLQRTNRRRKGKKFSLPSQNP